jgi:hypothetical protein
MAHDTEDGSGKSTGGHAQDLHGGLDSDELRLQCCQTALYGDADELGEV